MGFKTLKKVNEISEDNVDLKTFSASVYDLLYISNGNGDTLWVSSGTKEIFGFNESDFIGVNVRELERKRVFFPSATVRVLESRSPATLFQETKSGKRLFVYASPVMDETGRIIRIVNVSNDVTEVARLQNGLEKAQAVVAKYREELIRVRCHNFLQGQMVVASPKIKRLMKLAEKVAQVDATVLITGESGVGKEVFARSIHQLSQRYNRPFIAVNCGAIPEALLESELFGYTKGSFTGANRDGKMGLFEAAQGGTIFLDEVGELSAQFQVKLLRVLQDHKVTRIGSISPITLDVRIIAATNKNIDTLLENGQFREDLYYRLNVVPVEIPPLRERKEEIPLLIDFFVEKFNKKYQLFKKISDQAIEVFCEYYWPGNVRELENTIERLMVTTEKNIIDLQDFPDKIRGSSKSNQNLSLKELMKSIEYAIISDAYKAFKNTYTVAEVLGVSQSTVVRKLKTDPPSIEDALFKKFNFEF